MDSQTALTILLALIVALVVWVLTRRHAPKNMPPGLPAIPVLGSLPFSGLMGNNDIHVVLTRLAKTHGDMFHLWIGNRLMIVLNSYNIVREALVDNSVAMAGRSILSLPNHNVRKLGLVEPSYTPKWKHDRNLSLAILKEFGFGKTLMEDRIVKEVKQLLSHLDKLQKKEFDPCRFVQVSVSNVICSVLLGKHFEYDDKTFLDIIDRTDTYINAFTGVVVFEYLPMLRFLPSMKRNAKTFLQNHDEVLSIMMGFITEHKKCHVKGDDSDFIHAYLDQADTEEDDDESLLYIVRDLFNGGTETTTTFLRWAILYMVNYPGVQKKVQEELDHVLFDGRLPRLKDKVHLPYTEAVIQEVQRLGAVLPTAVPHQTLDDVSIGGYTIPKGTLVLCNLWAILRDPDLWPEPDKLKPERFLKEDGKVLHRPELIPFSLGRRSCPGEVMARHEMFLFFAAILHNYEIRRPEGVDKIDESGNFQVTRVPGRYNIVLTKRF